MSQMLVEVETLGDFVSQGKRQLPGILGLTIFFQDDITTFVFPDDGWGEGADDITHNHGIFPLSELLRGWSILKHELLWKMSKTRVRENSWFSHNDPFSLDPYCLDSSFRQLSIHIYSGTRKGPTQYLAKDVRWSGWHSRGIYRQSLAINIYSLSAKFSHFVQKRVYGRKGVSLPSVPCHVGWCH